VNPGVLSGGILSTLAERPATTRMEELGTGVACETDKEPDRRTKRYDASRKARGDPDMLHYPVDIEIEYLQEAQGILDQAHQAHLDAGGSRRDFGNDAFADQVVVAMARRLAALQKF
jgi:hypothetical protein